MAQKQQQVERSETKAKTLVDTNAALEAEMDKLEKKLGVRSVVGG